MTDETNAVQNNAKRDTPYTVMPMCHAKKRDSFSYSQIDVV